MAKKEVKTNAMRLLDRMKIPYQHFEYEEPKQVSGHDLGIQIADLLGQPHEKAFKTLVTKGSDGNYYVFVLPIAKELDFKKCAASVGVKSVEMIPVADINKVTGYIRGGTTAIGMKKQYVTRIAAEAKDLPEMIVSGGRIGSQLSLAPDDLLKACGGGYADITR